MMIDMHTHWRPSEVADALRARTREPRIVRNDNGVEVLKAPRMGEQALAEAFDQVEFHLARMDRQGVETSVLSLLGSFCWIEAQPLDYARVVGEGVALTFLRTDYTWRFPAQQPYATTTLSPRRRSYERQVLATYLGRSPGRLGSYLGRRLGTMVYQPESKLLVGYEQVAYLPGLVFALAFVIGLAGMVIRRRAGPELLLWVSGVVLLVLPIAENQFNYRYALPTVPLACMAAILAVARRPAAPRPGAPAPAAAAPARDTEETPAALAVTASAAAAPAGAGAAHPAAGQESGTWARTKSGLPIRKRPASPDPASPDPASPDPASPDPAEPGPG